MRDATARKTQRIFMEEFARAYGDRFRHAEDEPVCGCTHEQGAHHGDDGELWCGEEGCLCAAFHDPYPFPCHACLTGTWDETAARCLSCGLTIEAVAERSAR